MFGATSLFGVLSSFDHQIQDWKTYKSRIQQWFIANNIDESTDKAEVKKRAILLSALTEGTYQLASNLVLPKDIATISYETIIEALDVHFTPKRCGFAERCKFYAATQQVGESHAQWAARLRGLAANCAFKNLEDCLLDKFVMGMLPGHERDKLFAQDIQELSLSKAVNMAESVRCARVGAAVVPGGSEQHQEPVFKLSPKSSKQQFSVKCAVCGYTNHKASECRFVGYKCKKCNRKGHLKRVCPNNKKVNYVKEHSDDDEGDDGKCLFNIRCVNGKPMSETVLMEGIELNCEIDSGSAVSVISKITYNRLFAEVPLSQPRKKLITYSGGSLDIVGVMDVTVLYAGRTAALSVYVVQDGGPPLLGRDFIHRFNLQFAPVLYLESDDNSISEIIKQYPRVFSDKLGCLNNFAVKLPLKHDAKPIFIKARPVPFALRDKVNRELDRMVSLGILKPVNYSDYASPIVPVLKRNGSIRICADYSVTINKQLQVEKYPLPTIQELFTKLHGGEQFSKLDLSMAYNQCKIDEDSQHVTCINTPRGLFNYTRLTFGLSSAPAIFQRTMESIVGNMDGVLLFLDDVLITGKDKMQHLNRLQEVLRRLQDAGLTLQKDKCVFFQHEVSYLGYIINKNGIKKNPEKVKAILEATVPKNITELQSFLGLINYYRTFIPNASSILHPLHSLLQKGCKWNWSNEHNKAFMEIKNQLSSDQVLAHFNNNAKIILTVDASPNGLGAILSQIDATGREQPVSYASRSLTAAEKKYAQIQKEATAIIFGVKRFHQYLYGRSDPFILRTDHKPLTIIFGNHRGIPEVSANRLQRYAIFLSAYNYVIEYVKSVNNTADYLSRAIPVSNNSERVPARDEVSAYVNFAIEGCLPLTTKELQYETEQDVLLKKVSNYVLNGWPQKLGDTRIKPFFLCRNQIALERGILLRGHKVIIPETLRNKVLEELHASHFGIVKMKAEARARFWFPGIDAALEKIASDCSVCAQLRPAPPRAPLAPWPHPPAAFHRIHIDFLGPINNKSYLVIVDAFSKWVECYDMYSNTTSKAVITKLCDFMARFGIPNIIVSDNGTSFISQEFQNFCILNGIEHLRSPVYHPASNGQAESFVKIIKKGIKTILLLPSKANDFQMRLSKYLFDYRNSTNGTTGTSPAQLVFGHGLRSRLDLFICNETPSSTSLCSHVKRQQCSQAKYYGGVKRKDFVIGETVWVKQFVNKSRYYWSKGVIKRKIGKVIYEVYIAKFQKKVLRHKNQLYRRCKDSLYDSTNNWTLDDIDFCAVPPHNITHNPPVLPITAADQAEDEPPAEPADSQEARNTIPCTTEGDTAPVVSDVAAPEPIVITVDSTEPTQATTAPEPDVVMPGSTRIRQPKADGGTRLPASSRSRRDRPVVDYRKLFK